MGILKVKRGPGVRTTGVAGPQAKGRNWAKETTLSREQQGAMGASARRVVRSGVRKFTLAATQTEEGGGSLGSTLTPGETAVGISEDNGGHCDQGSSRGLTPQDTGSHRTRVSLGQTPKVAATLPPDAVHPDS